MKKLIYIPVLLAILALLPACATFKSNAGKTLSSTALTVDAAMKGWAAYVVTANVPPDKQMPVRVAYGQYQTAMLAARDAYVTLMTANNQSVWTTAEQALTAASANLTKLIQQITTKGTP